MTDARILDVTPDEYHRLPGFSSTLAKLLIQRSAAHARDAYERKLEAEVEAGGADSELTEQQIATRERGTILHTLILGKGKRLKVLPFKDYKTKDARAARDKARAEGLVPVKESKMEVLERTAIALRSRLASMGHELTGTSELAIAWTEETPHGPVPCRAMLDHVEIWGLEEGSRFAPEAVISDVKIIDDATPSKVERSAEQLGHAIQRAAYTRALAALYQRLAGRITFRFLFCEPRRPYEVYAPKPDGAFRELGERRWIRAVNAWARGSATGEWPGYGQLGDISAPVWVLREEGLAVDG